MIWLASYPRSGNTFMRNILYHVYGLESSVHHNLPDRSSPDDFFKYPVVKTHLLPKDLEPFHRNEPSVYIVRDGRDAIVSEAWHRKNFHAPKSKLHYNMMDAILADKDSHFAGWSRNVIDWIKKADVIIRFEDLVVHPIRETEKLRAIMKLPQPNNQSLPLFENFQSDNIAYGEGEEKMNSHYFKKGIWKKEMPRWMRPVFWRYHGHVMELLGYHKDGSMIPDFNIDQRKQKIHHIFHDYPSRTMGENMRLLLTKYGLLWKMPDSRSHHGLLVSNKVRDPDGIIKWRAQTGSSVTTAAIWLEQDRVEDVGNIYISA